LKVLIVTGMPGSGKSTAVEIARARGIPIYRMGDAVWAEVRSRGLRLENEVVGKVANEMRKTHGPGIWAERTVEQVRKGRPAQLIIIDGCRSQAEVDVFRKEFGDDLLLVVIEAT
jgi:dephospho-CoA kinase